MSVFEVAVQSVFAEEGSFVQDPADRGGATKYGISLRWLQSLGELPAHWGIDNPVTVETIRALTREHALFLYRTYFWNPHRYERLVHQRIATKAFDCTVNAGSRASHTALQWALRASGVETVRIDGFLGTQTINAANAADPQVLLAAFRSEIAGHYRLLKQPHFESGWLARAYA